MDKIPYFMTDTKWYRKINDIQRRQAELDANIDTVLASGVRIPVEAVVSYQKYYKLGISTIFEMNKTGVICESDLYLSKEDDERRTHLYNDPEFV